MKKKYYFLTLIVTLGFFWFFPLKTNAKEIVVVLDPGHGGENHGAEWNDLYEKDLTLVVANAMAETLNQFEGIKVYLTRTTDQELSLEDRVEFANSVGADYIYCLHFNMSAEHNLYFGSEFWIPSKGQNYVKGYQFSSILAEQFRDMGLYIRGIKTRLNSKGTDYYGIIRHAEEYGIPCTLIEHCHLDQKNDVPYYDSNEDLREFGRQDAIAVAKYYGLKSPSLGLDYSNYTLISCEVPTDVIKPDETPADLMNVSVDHIDTDAGTMTVSLLAEDYDSYINYYCYSIDGGNTFSELYLYPKEGATFTIALPMDQEINLVVGSYNSFDQDAYTEPMSLGILNPKPAVTPTESTEMQVKISNDSFSTSDAASETLTSNESLTLESDDIESTELILTEEIPKDDTIETVPVISASAQESSKKQYTSTQKILLILLLLFISLTCVIFSALLTFQVTKRRSKAKKKKKKHNKHNKQQEIPDDIAFYDLDDE